MSINSLRKRLMVRSSGRMLLMAWVLISFAATVMAPFHSAQVLSLPKLAIYWFVVVGMAMVFSILIARGVARFYPDRMDWRFALMRMVGMCLLFTPALYGWTLWLTGMPEVVPGFVVMLAFVALISIVVHALRRIVRAEAATFLAEDGGALVLSSAPETPPNPDPRLMRRLPEDARGPILRLSASDHFVEVHLTDTTHTLRMRFTDAIEEMDGVPGDCAHRSHWVTFDAISGVKRDGGRIFLIISNGDEVPVSRTYKSRMEDAGIL